MSDDVIQPTPVMVPLSTAAFPRIGGDTAGDGTFPQGTEVTIIATAYPDYAFSHWAYVNGLEASTEPSYTFALNTATDLTAHFRYDKTVFDLVKLTQCDNEGIQQRSVWVNPAHVIYVTVREDGITHALLRDGKELFVIERPRE
jgi:hypothetical protein